MNAIFSLQFISSFFLGGGSDDLATGLDCERDVTCGISLFDIENLSQLMMVYSFRGWVTAAARPRSLNQ